MSEGLAAVQARVAQLQSLLAPARPALPPATAPGGAKPGTAKGDDFASMLRALGGGAATAAAGAGAAGAASAADAAAPAAGGMGKRALALASSYTGVPYLWGGTDPDKGLDCSGLVQLVYRKLGVELPRVAADQSKAGRAVPSLDQARPGDLVFFGTPARHVGVYAGDGKMVDAPRTGSFVGLHKLWGPPSAIRRVTPADGAEGTGAVQPAGRPAGVAGAPGVAAVGGGRALSGPYAELFTAAGRRHGVDPALLSAVARTESSYNPTAVSPAGARGLMQLMPGTARSLKVDPLDPAQAVDGAARLLKELMQQFGGKVDLALAGYNAGPGAVRRYGGIPPYSETRTYVQRVQRAWEALS